MRLTVDGSAGELSAHPDRALGALADLAEVDGADRDLWLEKAIRSVGAVRREVEVDTTPRHQALADLLESAHAVHARAMGAMSAAIVARLAQAAEEADVDLNKG